MYASFFKLKRNPFEISPDPRFFVPTAAHNEALAGLHYGIQSHKGFMVLTGEVGTGKTLVVRCLLDVLDQLKLTYAYIFCTRLSSEEFLASVAADLGISAAPAKSALIKQFQEFLLSRGRQGLYTVLIVDEAQHLNTDVLEEIRLLTNLETPHGKLLQIALVGQPELDETLDSRAMRQLKQRIALRLRLRPLTPVQTRDYIWDRLKRAGARDPIFSIPAIGRVFVHSGGIPRLINTVCDNALISTFAAGLHKVPEAIVDEVAADLCLVRAERDQVGSPRSHPSLRSLEVAEDWTGFEEGPKELGDVKSVVSKS